MWTVLSPSLGATSHDKKSLPRIEAPAHRTPQPGSPGTDAARSNDQCSASGERQWHSSGERDFSTQGSHLPALRAPVCHADAPRAAYGNDAQAAAGGVAADADAANATAMVVIQRKSAAEDVDTTDPPSDHRIARRAKGLTTAPIGDIRADRVTGGKM